MTYYSERNHSLPLTLEPKNDDLYMEGSSVSNEFCSSNTNSATEEDEESPLKNYLSSRRLPSLDSLQNSHFQQQQDDYIRIKLSGMSVCVSPSSPRGHTLERGAASEYFPSPSEMNKASFDPVRSSMPLRRIVEDSNHRRHSIANLDSNRSVAYNNEYPSPPIPPPTHHYHTHPHHHHAPLLGHYSAPSSPPLQPSHRSAHSHMMGDTPPPPQATVQQKDFARRNSSALIYREKSTLETRRMSLNQYSRNSYLGKSTSATTDSASNTTEETMKDEMEGLYSRSPELRISHKLAERKRRREMKDLFEELKNALPVDKTLKTSKWEILSKAVEYITILRDKDQTMERELVMLKHQLESMKQQQH